MKKNVFILLTMLLSALTFSQVGVNTSNPIATFDVVAKNSTGNSTNVDGLLVPRVDRQRAQSMVGVPISTLIYVNNITTGTTTGTAVNIDAVGYYYFNGTVWVKINEGNIYNSNGTLTASRTVTMEGKGMTFRGTTGVFTVDTNNDGLTRTNFLNSNTGANSRKDIRIGAGTGSIYLGVDNSSVIFGAGTKGYIDNRSGGPLIIGRSGNEQMRIMENGTIGIGTTTPTQKLDVNGGVRIADLPNASLADRAVYADANGVLKISTASTANRTIWGVVRPNSNGTVTILNSGSGGWTATRNGVGTVIITAATPFTTPPAANAIQYLKDPINQVTNTTFQKASAQDNAGVDNVSLNQIQIWACDSNFNRTDRVISFSVTGF